MGLIKRKCLIVIVRYICEDIDNYSQLAKILYDFQAPDDTIKGRFSVTSATNGDYTSTGDTSGNLQIIRGVNRGAVTPIITTGTAVPFAINLISLVGSLARDKYLLLSEMTAAPLRVEIVFKPSVISSMLVVLGSATAPLFSFTGVNYVGEFLELPDSAISAIKAGSSSPMQMVLPSYRSYTNSVAITTGGTSTSFPIPAKFSSLKNIFVAGRTTTNAGTAGLFPMSHCKFGLTQYNFRVGSEIIPSTAPASVSEFYNEALKCFGSLADLNLQPSIDLISYGLNVPTTVTTLAGASTSDSGSFVLGVDMELFQNTNNQSIFQGTNSNNSDIFLLATYAPASDVTLNQVAFASYDQVLVFESGVCYARY